MSEIQIGTSGIQSFQVTDEMSPGHLPIKVLSTPDMIRLTEGTCHLALVPHLDEGQSSVGTHVCVSHQASVDSGETVDVHAVVSEVDRRRVTFDIRVTHGDTLVSEGTHQRFVIG